MTAARIYSEARKFVAFLAVGGLNAVFGYATFALLLCVGIAPTSAVVITTIVAMLFNFMSLGSLFGSRARDRLPRYVAVYLVLLGLNIVLLQLLLRGHIPALIGQGVAVAILSPLSFLAMRRFVFAGEP